MLCTWEYTSAPFTAVFMFRGDVDLVGASSYMASIELGVIGNLALASTDVVLSLLVKSLQNIKTVWGRRDLSFH